MSANPARSGFAAAAQRLSQARANPRERRRFRRLSLELGGRMLDPRGREHDCRTADISPGDVRIASPAEIEVGARVVLYLASLGRIAGTVVRVCGPGEYAIVFESSAHKREKLAEALTAMINSDRLSSEDSAAPSPSARHFARIELEDGEIVDGAILDFSLAGITIKSANRPPPLGAWVKVGGVHGKVARYVEGGFSVDFEFRNPAQPG